MFEVLGWRKEAREDSFEEGLIGDCSLFAGSDRIIGRTVEELVKNLQDFFWCEYVVLGACEEPNRIDLSRMEDADGNRAFEDDIEKWKAGRKQLWQCTYTVYVDEVVRKPTILEEQEYELETRNSN